MLGNVILGTVCFGSFLYWYVTRTFDYWKDRHVIGPKPIPFFGNTKEVALRKKILAEVVRDIYNKYPKEKVVGFYTMTSPCLLLRDLDIIKQIMIRDFDIFSDRGVEFSEEGLGANLFHSESELWQALRGKFTPMFTPAKLKSMTYLIVEKADKLVDHVKHLCESNNEIEISRVLNKYTVSAVSSCVFGIDIDLDKEKMELLQEINTIMLRMNNAIELEMLCPGSLKKLNMGLFPKILNTFFVDLVESLIKERNGKPTNRKDLIDVILEMKQEGAVSERQKDGSKVIEFTNSIIAAQAAIFYIGGNETSSTTMTNMLYQLALNPDVQEKLLDEIDECNRELTYDTVMSMKYLTQVFDETLRMYPIVEPLQRRAKQDCMISDVNIKVEKNKFVFVSNLGIHYDEKYYADPYKFDPERFNAENSKNRDPAAYMPFGMGPRYCIGRRFGKLQTLIGIVKFLSNFRVEPSKKTPKTMKLDPCRHALGPLNGIHLSIVPRSETRRNL